MLTSVHLPGNFVNHDPSCKWAPIFTKIWWVIKNTISYGPIHEWASMFTEILTVIKLPKIMEPFVNGHLYSPKHYRLLSTLLAMEREYNFSHITATKEEMAHSPSSK